VSDQPQDKPKIIIDEDWKNQAQSEKETLAAAPKDEEGGAGAAGGMPPMPEASLLTLVSTLASQAMFSLGAIPHPMTGQVEVDFEQAKHFIDTLAVLEEKTAGNRTEEEDTTLTQVVHELRMAFVGMQQAPPAPGDSAAPEGPASSGIVMP
jgi:hypothetical protein